MITIAAITIALGIIGYESKKPIVQSTATKIDTGKPQIPDVLVYPMPYFEGATNFLISNSKTKFDSTILGSYTFEEKDISYGFVSITHKTSDTIILFTVTRAIGKNKFGTIICDIHKEHIDLTAHDTTSIALFKHGLDLLLRKL